MSHRDFEQILLEAVDEGFATLGESSKQAIYFHLDKIFNIKKREIPNKVESFTNAMENIFGIGASFLEILIMEKLHEKIGHDIIKWQKHKELKFAEYVTALRRSFSENQTDNGTEETIGCQQVIMKG